MNFLKLYIGDYLRDTGTLTVAEHGAYMLMLLHVYATERPLPQGRELHRLLRAETKADRDAIDSVASRFWYVTPGGLLNKRADLEMVKANHQREVNRSVGKLGGRPKRIETESVIESGAEPEPNRNHNHSQTPEKEVSKPSASHPPAAAAGPRTASVPCPYEAIVSAYHDILPSLPRVKLMPAKRQAAMRKLWGWVLSSRKSDGARRATNADEALQWLRGYFEHAQHNDFLMGRTARPTEHAGWQCDLDFLLTEKGMKQVIEKTVEQAAA